MGEKASELRRGMIAMKDDATSLLVIYGVSISGLALFAYFLFRCAHVAALQQLTHMTHASQPKHGGVQLLQRRHFITAARHEQRRPVEELSLFEQNHRLRVLVHFQFIWPICINAHVFGKRSR